jgi:AraC-like DNA-binding protein
MIQTVFDSALLPAAERFEQFDECQRTGSHPMRVLAAAPERFHATVRELDLATVNVVELACSESEIVRTPRMIRTYDPALCSVVVPVRGRIDLSHHDREVSLGVGDLALYDSSHPFRVRLSAGTTLVRAHLPAGLLPLPTDEVDRMLGARLPGGAGVGGLLAEFLTKMVADSATYRPADVARLDTVVVDLLTAALAHHLDAEAPDAAGRRALLTRIDAFLRQHLGDPELSPRTVAAAHHISVSYLHRLFREQGVTVAASIRRQRLEQARRDLADPALLGVPVHRIAARWGFADHATFTRAFRAAYDIAPKDYRHTTAPLSA